MFSLRVFCLKIGDGHPILHPMAIMIFTQCRTSATCCISSKRAASCLKVPSDVIGRTGLKHAETC